MTGVPQDGPRPGRDVPGAAAALRARGADLVPEWEPGETGAGAALVAVAAHYLVTAGRRLGRAPEISRTAFLELLGIRLVPAQPARAPIVVTLEPGASDQRVPAGTRLAAPPPPGATDQVFYETERSTGLAVARIVEVLSVWPGRDQYLDHTAAAAAGEPFTPFRRRLLTDQPHHLYLAHDELFALAGSARVTVRVELSVPGSEALDLRWEYWDGAAWRGFADTDPACSSGEAETLDSTGGLRHSGTVRLESDGATNEPTTVDGRTGRWVRARLAHALPPDPRRVLPQVSAIRIGSVIEQRYSRPWLVRHEAATVPAPARRGGHGRLVRVSVRDGSGIPIAGVTVSSPISVDAEPTGPDGTTWVQVTPTQPTPVTVHLGSVEQQEIVPPLGERPEQLVFTLDMAPLDRAVAEGVEVDLSRPFAPLGASPQPGATFYIAHDGAFGRPGASVRLYLQSAQSPPEDDGGTDLAHTVSWDYWNGQRWVSLFVAREHEPGGADEPVPGAFTATGLVELTIPADAAPTTVAGTPGWWLRARLVDGGYGRRTRIGVIDIERRDLRAPARAAAAAAPSSLPVFVPRPPLLADLRVGYAWQTGPVAPQHVLTYNDFGYADRSDVAAWPGGSFAPFDPPSDPTPALYLGLDRALPVDDLGLFVDVAEVPGESTGPPLLWEYWNGFVWAALRVTDETRNLRVPGIVRFVGPPDMAELARFGVARRWVRARLAQDGPPGEPTLSTVHLNAVWVEQRQTILDEAMGTSTGEPTQVLAFRQVPVLPGQEVEVRESAGPRADVDWRIVAAELFPGDPRAVPDLEERLAAEGIDPEVRRGPLRLRRDRTKRVNEVWVRWTEHEDLDSAGPDDRAYAVHRARGLLLFGGSGRVPPVGAAVRAVLYRSGGGTAGNAPAGAISQFLGPIGGLETVRNPLPAGGGAETESAERVSRRGPATLAHRGRALSGRDYETMAYEASSGVAVARAVPGTGPDGRRAPGRVTLVLVPAGAEPRPYPSFGLRSVVRRYLLDRMPAGVGDGLVVTGPEYVGVDVTATVVLLDPSEAGAVERRVRAAVEDFLHPLRGGRSGRGRAPGRDVHLSELAAVVERTDGVDHARELALLDGGVEQGATFPVAPGRLAAASTVTLTLVGE